MWPIGFLFLFILLTVQCAAPGPRVADEARQAATWRQRRVIFNNDGDDALHYKKWHEESNLTPPEKDGFLPVRMKHCFDAGVDSVFFCTHHWSPSSIKVNDGGKPDPRIKKGFDALDVVIRECRRRNIEAIWTLRLNDIHDTFWASLMPQWKKDYPHLLMGTEQDKKKYPVADPRHIWTFADFAHLEVRDMIVSVVRDALARHDMDGVDLDFLRHPAYFKETLVDEPATPAHLDMVTEMIGRIRQHVLAASERRGKPILLSVRVLPTWPQNLAWGFDVERWVREDYVDFITVGGGYDPFTVPAKDMVDRGHQWGIPVYVCLSTSGFGDAVSRVPDSRAGHSIECWRAAAANAWDTGADGIMTFNLFPRFDGTKPTEFSRRVWGEILDAAALARKDKIYCIENVDELWAAGYMVRSVPREGHLPVPLPKGATVECAMPVGDDFSSFQDMLESLRLRICVAGGKGDERIRIKMNQTVLVPSPEKTQWLIADVPPTAMRRGDNAIELTYVDGKSESLEIIGAELVVDYR